MTQVFSPPAMDTPVLTPGWTVQNSATGSNQSLTSNSGAGTNNGVGLISGQQPAITAPTGGSTVDSQARTAVSSLITELTSAGILA